MMRNILMAVRANAQATIEMVDGLLSALAELEKQEQPEEPAIEYSSATCTHPDSARRPVPRMGAPRAWVCGLCGATGGTEEASAPAAAPEQEG